jgi:hypothetical protein
MSSIHPVLEAVTDRITERSSAAYPQQTREAEHRGPARASHLRQPGCTVPRIPRQHTHPAGCHFGESGKIGAVLARMVPRR